jgi:CheY-like chemotaxis protein
LFSQKVRDKKPLESSRLNPDNDNALLAQFSLLYVEDDEHIRDQLTQFLKRRASVLHVATNGAEGLELYRRHQPDMVVSDILMPQMNGLEMAESIRALNAEVPIIVTTAFNETDYFLKAIQIGVDNYVLKPVDPAMLGRALHKSARVLHQRRELARQSGQMQQMLKDLQQYHDAAERENHLVSQLMERTLRERNLSDPVLHSWIAPATHFSGDLVAAQRAPNGDLFLVLGDATGHGLAAAMNLLPLSRIFYRMVERGFTLSAMLPELNGVIREQSTADRFVALTLARVDARNGIVEVWNGGNPPAIWLCGGETRLFKSTNLALGIIENSLVDVRTEVLPWQGEAQLLLFSDGLIEAENPAGQPLGLEALLGGVAPLPGAARLAGAVRRVQNHLGGGAAHDDMSLIVADCLKEERS